MAKFILSALLIIIALITKIFFFSQEVAFSASWLAKTELLVLAALFLWGVGDFLLRDRKLKEGLVSKTQSRPGVVFFIFCLATFLTLSLSFNLASNKKSLEWDAIALYDARAQFLKSGMKFSEMVSLSKYDSLNSYYYVLYPPFTSIIHYFADGLGVTPVTVVYSIMLLIFGLFLIFCTKERLGWTWAAILTFLVIANGPIFDSATTEYTTLPFALFLAAGILLIVSHITTGKWWEFIFGTVLVGLSQWIRFLEPIWMVVVAAYVFSFPLQKFRPSKFLLFAGVGAIEYLSWRHFTKVVAQSPEIFKFSFINFLEPIIGVITGSLVRISAFFLSSLAFPLLIYLVALLTIFDTKSRSLLGRLFPAEERSVTFLKLTIVFSLTLYFSGLYILSFKVDWWEEMASSIGRSSRFLVPVAAYLIILRLKEYFKKI